MALSPEQQAVADRLRTTTISHAEMLRRDRAAHAQHKAAVAKTLKEKN